MKEATLDLTRVKTLASTLPKHLVYLMRVYLLGVAGFMIFRILLLIQEFHQLHFLPTGQGIWLVFKAFLMGLRFDTVVMGYILTLPFLLLTIDALAKLDSKWIFRISATLVFLGVAAALFIHASDLPFFHHFYTRVSTSIFISADKGESGDMLSGMIFEEWRFSWPLIPFFILAGIFFKRNRRLLHTILYQQEETSVGSSAKWFALSAAALFLGIWGRFSFQSHLAASTAYNSEYGFINMLGLNPAFTFTQSYVNSKTDAKNVRLMGDGEAVRNVQQYLNIPEAQEFDSPIARQITFADSAVNKPNVVLVIMESMSASKMGRYGNPNHLTPFMDSLATQSMTFDSVFTAGIHTFAGVYATLFSHQVVKRKHPLDKVVPMSGIASTLKQHGYSTIYFTTHDKGFDNVNAFLTANDYDQIVSKDNYPPDRVLSALGVPDDYLYEHAVGDLDRLNGTGKPFFAAIMTGSDHGPYIIPKYFHPKHEDPILGVIEYVDWSVQKFLQMASQKPWFDNTIFVFLADHGTSLDKRYDMPTSYLHSPLIVYAPKLLGAPQTMPQLGSQVDVFPTIMGMLHLPYVNNTFGIDLLREKRPFACAYADDKWAVLNTEYMYVARDNGVNSLYRYRTGDLKDYSKALPGLTQEMKTYGESIFQTTQWIRHNGKQVMQ